jgi:hypothetical protein
MKWQLSFLQIGFRIEHYKESEPLGLIKHFSLDATKNKAQPTKVYFV